jgi:hypothetical protein
MSARSRDRMLTVTDPQDGQTYTDRAAVLAIVFGVPYQTLYKRLTRLSWSAEQSLGLAPPPAPAMDRRRKLTALPELAPCGTAYGNLLAAAMGEITAEEYLRREGVGSNGYVLPFHEGLI